jgi:RNA polymerase sigma factor (sigma-70 family)
MRSLYDSTDFASDAWKSLIAKSGRFDFPTIDHLMAFLSQVAHRKLIDVHRRLHTLKNDVSRQRPIEGGGADPELREPPSNEPPPSQVAATDEILDKLLSGLGEPERTIVLLKWQGESNEAIATQIGWRLRRVQRFLQNLYDSRLRPATEGAPERQPRTARPRIGQSGIDLRGEDLGEYAQERDDGTVSPPLAQQESRPDGEVREQGA